MLIVNKQKIVRKKKKKCQQYMANLSIPKDYLCSKKNCDWNLYGILELSYGENLYFYTGHETNHSAKICQYYHEFWTNDLILIAFKILSAFNLCNKVCFIIGSTFLNFLGLVAM